MIVAAFWACLAGVAWVYAVYPATLAILGRLAPRPRRRAPLELPVSVVIAAHDEEAVIESKLRNVLASDYPAGLVEVIVASDGSSDRTVMRARRAGADTVLDLPRIGKLSALNRAVERATGEILVFTDADSLFEPQTLAELVANFADAEVGGVSANEVRLVSPAEAAVVQGEGLYWRYEQWIKRLEDRVGSAVSASGRLYAVRRSLFVPSRVTAATDDFVISTGVVRAGRRLAFDHRARVLVDLPADDLGELRRKVRVMNRGLRAAFSLGPMLVPFRGGLYGAQVLSHKVARRFVPFLLVGLLATSARLTAKSGVWWAALAPQLGLYGLAATGWLARDSRWGRAKALYVPYFFCLGNLAAALAVLSLLRGVRVEVWEPAGARPPRRAAERSGGEEAAQPPRPRPARRFAGAPPASSR